jgi:hypothetical protein
MVLLLFLWPYYQTGGFIEYSIFPEAYAPYTWGAIGDGFRWLALTVVFPWGPYLASMCLAVLIFSLVYRHYWFTKQERLLVLGTIAMCGALFCVLLPLWISQLIWFY